MQSAPRYSISFISKFSTPRQRAAAFGAIMKTQGSWPFPVKLTSTNLLW
jgi:hypothetical protein